MAPLAGQARHSDAGVVVCPCHACKGGCPTGIVPLATDAFVAAPDRVLPVSVYESSWGVWYHWLSTQTPVEGGRWVPSGYAISLLRLEGVRRRFDVWRRGRKVRSRIPKPLWAAAVKIAGRYGVLSANAKTSTWWGGRSRERRARLSRLPWPSTMAVMGAHGFPNLLKSNDRTCPFYTYV